METSSAESRGHGVTARDTRRPGADVGQNRRRPERRQASPSLPVGDGRNRSIPDLYAALMRVLPGRRGHAAALFILAGASGPADEANAPFKTRLGCQGPRGGAPLPLPVPSQRDAALVIPALRLPTASLAANACLASSRRSGGRAGREQGGTNLRGNAPFLPEISSVVMEFRSSLAGVNVAQAARATTHGSILVLMKMKKLVKEEQRGGGGAAVLDRNGGSESATRRLRASVPEWRRRRRGRAGASAGVVD